MELFKSRLSAYHVLYRVKEDTRMILIAFQTKSLFPDHSTKLVEFLDHRGWKVSSSLRGRPTYEEELAVPILGVQWQSLKSEAKT